MQYNIFKIEKKEKLLEEMIKKKYHSNGNVLNSGKFSLELYYEKKEATGISWQNVLNEFGIDLSISKDNLKGILIADSEDETYAITYGMSSSLVQKYCDSEYPMEIAKRVEISKVKRKASKILNGSTNSLIKTLTDANVVVLDKGESVVNLEIVPTEQENLGKLVGIGKSVRVNLDKNIDSLEEIVNSLNKVLASDKKRQIPLLLKLKEDELVGNIWEHLTKKLIEGIDNPEFSLSDINILGSSIYFNDNFRLELWFKNKHKEIPFLNTSYVNSFITENNIKKEEIYDYLKIKYISDDGNSFTKSFKEIITYDFEYNNERYVVYDGDIYYYNDDFLDGIREGIKNIKFEVYNKEDDKGQEWYEKYLKENNLVDVRDKKKAGKNSTYREQAINIDLSRIYNYENLDRKLAHICENENYEIEVADLGKKEEVLYAVKVGTPRDFCYAIDQSNLVLDTFASNVYDKEKIVEEYKDVKEIGLWLFVTGSNNFLKEDGTINIFSFKSIMFLNKLVEWSNKVISLNKIPVIKMNYYRKKAK